MESLGRRQLLRVVSRPEWVITPSSEGGHTTLGAQARTREDHQSIRTRDAFCNGIDGGFGNLDPPGKDVL